jgi:hypothetical protein
MWTDLWRSARVVSIRREAVSVCFSPGQCTHTFAGQLFIFFGSTYTEFCQESHRDHHILLIHLHRCQYTHEKMRKHLQNNTDEEVGTPELNTSTRITKHTSCIPPLPMKCRLSFLTISTHIATRNKRPQRLQLSPSSTAGRAVGTLDDFTTPHMNNTSAHITKHTSCIPPPPIKYCLSCVAVYAHIPCKISDHNVLQWLPSSTVCRVISTTECVERAQSASQRLPPPTVRTHPPSPSYRSYFPTELHHPAGSIQMRRHSPINS